MQSEPAAAAAAEGVEAGESPQTHDKVDTHQATQVATPGSQKTETTKRPADSEVRPPSEPLKPLKAFNLDEQPWKPFKRHFWPLVTFILMFVVFIFLSGCIFPCRVYVFQLSFQNSKDVSLLQQWNLNLNLLWS